MSENIVWNVPTTGTGKYSQFWYRHSCTVLWMCGMLYWIWQHFLFTFYPLEYY